MAKVRLQVLAPGRRCVGRNADGSRRYVTFTPEYVRDQVERNNVMLAAGFPVPLAWEHRNDAKPGAVNRDEWATQRAKGTAGWVERYELDADGKAWSVNEIPDEADLRQAEKVRFCSPEIDRFVDGDGRDWGEVFTHIALTPRPVQHDQPPIARLSYLGPIRLSIDPAEGTDMADEPKEETPKEEPKEEPKKEEPKEDLGPVQPVIEALREYGLNIPDEVKDIAGLVIAIKASKAAPGGDLDDDDAVVVSSQGTAGGTGGGMSLSLEKQTRVAEELARKNTAKRLNRLLKNHQITGAIHTAMSGRLAKVRLSFGDDGDLQTNDVLAEIAAYERLPKGHVRTDSPGGVRLSNVEEVDPLPPSDAPDESPAARQARFEAFQATKRR